eukprot:1714721-Amphidinium_carterae.1
MAFPLKLAGRASDSCCWLRRGLCQCCICSHVRFVSCWHIVSTTGRGSTVGFGFHLWDGQAL